MRSSPVSASVFEIVEISEGCMNSFAERFTAILPNSSPSSCHDFALRHASSSTKPADSGDEPGLLGDGQEVVGRNKSALGVLPAHERLESYDASVAHVDLRLVVDDELAMLDRAAQLDFSAQPLLGARCPSRWCRCVNWLWPTPSSGTSRYRPS